MFSSNAIDVLQLINKQDYRTLTLEQLSEEFKKFTSLQDDLQNQLNTYAAEEKNQVEEQAQKNVLLLGLLEAQKNIEFTPEEFKEVQNKQSVLNLENAQIKKEIQQGVDQLKQYNKQLDEIVADAFTQDVDVQDGMDSLHSNLRAKKSKVAEINHELSKISASIAEYESIQKNISQIDLLKQDMECEEKALKLCKDRLFATNNSLTRCKLHLKRLLNQQIIMECTSISDGDSSIMNEAMSLPTEIKMEDDTHSKKRKCGELESKSLNFAINSVARAISKLSFSNKSYDQEFLNAESSLVKLKEKLNKSTGWEMSQNDIQETINGLVSLKKQIGKVAKTHDNKEKTINGYVSKIHTIYYQFCEAHGRSPIIDNSIQELEIDEDLGSKKRRFSGANKRGVSTDDAMSDNDNINNNTSFLNRKIFDVKKVLKRLVAGAAVMPVDFEDLASLIEGFDSDLKKSLSFSESKKEFKAIQSLINALYNRSREFGNGNRNARVAFQKATSRLASLYGSTLLNFDDNTEELRCFILLANMYNINIYDMTELKKLPNHIKQLEKDIAPLINSDNYTYVNSLLLPDWKFNCALDILEDEVLSNNAEAVSIAANILTDLEREYELVGGDPGNTADLKVRAIKQLTELTPKITNFNNNQNVEMNSQVVSRAITQQTSSSSSSTIIQAVMQQPTSAINVKVSGVVILQSIPHSVSAFQASPSAHQMSSVGGRQLNGQLFKILSPKPHLTQQSNQTTVSSNANQDKVNISNNNGGGR